MDKGGVDNEPGNVPVEIPRASLLSSFSSSSELLNAFIRTSKKPVNDDRDKGEREGLPNTRVGSSRALAYYICRLCPLPPYGGAFIGFLEFLERGPRVRN